MQIKGLSAFVTVVDSQLRRALVSQRRPGRRTPDCSCVDPSRLRLGPRTSLSGTATISHWWVRRRAGTVPVVLRGQAVAIVVSSLKAAP